jgi:hypothetical protein
MSAIGGARNSNHEALAKTVDSSSTKRKWRSPQIIIPAIAAGTEKPNFSVNERTFFPISGGTIFYGHS